MLPDFASFIILLACACLAASLNACVHQAHAWAHCSSTICTAEVLRHVTTTMCVGLALPEANGAIRAARVSVWEVHTLRGGETLPALWPGCSIYHAECRAVHAVLLQDGNVIAQQQ